MEYVFICSAKWSDLSFALLTQEEADEWVSLEPEYNYYNKIPLQRF